MLHQKFSAATDLQWQRKRHIRVCECVPTKNIYDSSVITMAFFFFLKTLILSPHTHTHTQKTAFISAKNPRHPKIKASHCPSTVQRRQSAGCSRHLRSSSRLTHDHTRSCWGSAGDVDVVHSAAAAASLASPPRLPVSSPRLFPSGRVPAGPRTGRRPQCSGAPAMEITASGRTGRGGSGGPDGQEVGARRLISGSWKVGGLTSWRGGKQVMVGWRRGRVGVVVAGTQQEGIEGASSYCQRTFRAGLNSKDKIKHRKGGRTKWNKQPRNRQTDREKIETEGQRVEGRSLPIGTVERW